MANTILSFISDEDLRLHTEKVLKAVQAAAGSAEVKLYSNVLDPFSAIFDASRQDISLDLWIEQEKSRQIQKTMQNAVGEFHENILGSIPGWEKLPVGQVIDLKNMERKVIAEIKNKHNTTKGNHKKDIYDDIKSRLEGVYKGFIGYYVEIIPGKKEPYDHPFTPSDNVGGGRRPTNESIRVIDGKSFYTLVTNKPNALIELYKALPIIICQVLGTDPKKITDDDLFLKIFGKAYKI